MNYKVKVYVYRYDSQNDETLEEFKYTHKFRAEESAENFIEFCVKECLNNGYQGYYVENNITYIDDNNDCIRFERLWK